MGLSLTHTHSCSTHYRLSLSLVAWPNPEAQRHYSISVTFDGPGLKQIYIPLVDFKRCLNNDARQRRVNEAYSGLAMSDFKINLIRSRDFICAPPSPFAPSLREPVSHPSHSLIFLPLFSFQFTKSHFSLSIFKLYFSFTPLSCYSLVSEACLN